MTELADPKPISPVKARIAQLIADPKNLSYAEIGRMLTPPIAENTVKSYVRQMSEELFDGDTRDAYPPRIQILVWVRQMQWNLGHMPRLHELIEASVERNL